MNILPVLPTLTCLTAAVLQCLFWSRFKIKQTLHLGAAFLLLVVNIGVFVATDNQAYLVTQLGGYPAPFGITFVIDNLSALMLLVTAIITLAVTFYSFADEDVREHHTTFMPTYWLLAAGICGAFSTGDLFNLYVWVEIMLIASFVLMVLGNHQIQLDGTIKYVAINLIATILLLTAIALLYGLTGTLNLSDMSTILAAKPSSSLLLAASGLLAIAFGIKAAVFPLFFWLPASYHTTSVTASSIFAGMLTKVGVYALFRIFTLLFAKEGFFFHPLLLICAGLTMFTGVVGAAAQYNFRRILSFHIISQVGYMVLGLAIFTHASIAAALFFMVHNMFAKTSLFLISGVVHRFRHSFELNYLGGLYQAMPYLSLLFFISAFSLAGFPPSSGFWSKLLLLKAVLAQSHYFLALIALIVSFMTLYSMVKIWSFVFWRSGHEAVHKPVTIHTHEKISLFSSVILLCGVTLLIGFMPQWLFRTTDKASEQLLSPEQYRHVVMEVGQ